MTTDAELLRRYLEERSESAFAELVQRHLGVVYAAALRRTNCHHDLAEEVAQRVFTDLARKSAALKDHPTLAGWLYRTTRYAAIDALRGEIRRQKLAQKLQTMPDDATQPDSPPHLDWESLRPVLDEAMDQLKERDRELMLLRFFHGLTFAEVGRRLRLTENGARMRSERALEKLRNHLGKRGVTSTAAALGTFLTNQALASAPAGLASTVTTAAVAAGPATGIAGLGTIILMSKLTAPFASALAAAGLTALVYTSGAKSPDAELTALRKENARLVQVTAAGAPATSVAAAADEFATQAAALAKALADRQTARSELAATQTTTNVNRPEVTPRGHRNRGTATPHEAAMTFAYACDVADPAVLAKLVYIDEASRGDAAKMLASMPESIRTQYPTPEAFYGLCLAAACIEAPPPGADLIERFMEIVETGPGRVATRKRGTERIQHEYQQTADGWKYILPPEAIKYLPRNLNSDILAKLNTR